MAAWWWGWWAAPADDLVGWEDLVDQVVAVDAGQRAVRIAIVGKYTDHQDAYGSAIEALRRAGYKHGARADIQWVDAEQLAEPVGVADEHPTGASTGL